jgi:hypothetical protein
MEIAISSQKAELFSNIQLSFSGFVTGFERLDF